mgnify:CR=1 FL=1
MSSFGAPTFHPKTGKIEDALWFDDYFGRHHYGVQFPDGEVFDPYKDECERVHPKAADHIDALEKQIEGLKWDLDSAQRTIRKMEAEE